MSNWIQLDDRRETWLFLVIDFPHEPSQAERSSDSNPSWWEIGVGNADTIVDTNAARLDSEQPGAREQFIRGLAEALEPYRYDGVTIITPTEATITQFRTELVKLEGCSVTLRGFRHLSMEALIQEYLDSSLEELDVSPENWRPPRITETEPHEVVSRGTVDSLWQVWSRVFKLLPVDELSGARV